MSAMSVVHVLWDHNGECRKRLQEYGINTWLSGCKSNVCRWYKVSMEVDHHNSGCTITKLKADEPWVAWVHKAGTSTEVMIPGDTDVSPNLKAVVRISYGQDGPIMAPPLLTGNVPVLTMNQGLKTLDGKVFQDGLTALEAAAADVVLGNCSSVTESDQWLSFPDPASLFNIGSDDPDKLFVLWVAMKSGNLEAITRLLQDTQLRRVKQEPEANRRSYLDNLHEKNRFLPARLWSDIADKNHERDREGRARLSKKEIQNLVTAWFKSNRYLFEQLDMQVDETQQGALKSAGAV